MLKTQRAREWRSKNPETPTLALARRMYAKNKLLFKNLDDARYFLRYVEGKTGDTNRKNVKEKDLIKQEPRPYNPYKLPASDETIYEPYQIKGHQRIAIFSDIHAPYHNISALTAAIDFCKKEKPDALLLNGDTIDCHRLSRFIKDPAKRNFALELDTFKSLFEIFKRELKCKIYFKIGNHEERYEHFLQEKAGELIGVEEFTFENIIKARAEGIEIIGDKRPMQIGSLWGIHGHEYVGGITAPVNPARGLMLQAKASCFKGHNHQTSEQVEPTITGKLLTTWSIGCLSELHPAYMPLNKWNHGFAMVDVSGKEFEFRNKRIFNGKIL